MNAPVMHAPLRVAADTTSLPSFMPVPGFGVLAVNAFVIEAVEPVLIDTGLAAVGDGFMSALRGTVDLQRLKWIWLTHVDPDHTGNLRAVLDEAPNVRVVTTFLGMGKMGLHGLPVERVYLLNPGQNLDVGDRQLAAMTPPSFDAPETTGLFDTRTRTLFSADCFGALLDAPAGDAADIDPGALRDGSVAWGAVDAPWLRSVDSRKLAASVEFVRGLEPRVVLSSHLPRAERMLDTLVGHLLAVQRAQPFVGPDQSALEGMLGAA